jgi:membrane protease YdiL (CAAX protease family)
VPVSAAEFAVSLELLLMLGGLILLWRLVFSPAARARRQPPALPRWEAPLPEFAVFLCLIMFGALSGGFIASGFVQRLGLAGDEVTVFQGAAFQVGMLGGVAMFHYGFSRTPTSPGPRHPGIFASGAATFLISLPVVTAAAAAWEALLRVSGLPVERQDLIDMFANVDSPFLLVTMVVLAIGTAPVSEEFVFRAGLYRYLRGRLPAVVAMLAPAVLFASLHVDWKSLEGLASFGPLVMLAVVFSLAYARTGRIGTSMVAHALFNLNTILMIFAGADI